MARPVGWFEITVADVEAAAEWYGGLFGWQVHHLPEMGYATVATGGLDGGLTTEGGGVTVYVQTDDLEGTLAAAVERGAAVVVPVTVVPDVVTFAQVADPDGNVIGLMAATEPPAPAPRHVLLYHPVPDILERAGDHMPAHAARLAEFREAGTLLHVGTFGEPATQGSMSIFTSREAAEAFVAGDPFVAHGLVARHEIREWHVAW